MPNWDISRGFLYVCIIYIACKIRAAVRAGYINFLASLVQWNISRVILQIKASVIQWKDIRYAPGNPSLSPKRSILFLKFRGIFSVYFVGRISEAAMGGP